MKWEDFRRSDNVEDRTGMDSGGGFGGGGMKLGGGALILIVIVSLLFGVNPLTLIGGLDSGGPAPQDQAQPPPGYGPQRSTPAPGGGAAPQDPAKEFSARILGDTEDVWGAIFQAAGTHYVPPQARPLSRRRPVRMRPRLRLGGALLLLAGSQLYLDTAFFNELSRRFKAPGDFAQAYVIAHEIGHHVQNLTGTMQQVDAQIAASGRARPQRAVDPPRVAGRLLCRRMGLFRAEAQRARRAATSRKGSPPPPRSATTRSRSARKAT